MLHVVFSESEVALMQEVIKLDETLAGEIYQVRDDFAVGPVQNLDTDEGWQARTEWWKQLLQGSPYLAEQEGKPDDRELVNQIREKMDADPGLELWIWMGQNQHDVTGYFWLMSQLRAYQGRVMVLYLNNLPFINEKGQLFYPSWLHEIQPREFLKAKKLARPITLSEFEIDPDEWRKIMEENAPVRILEGGKKIVGKEENFFDNEILKQVTKEWQKASRVLSNTLHRMKIKTGDVFLMRRMKELVADGKLSITGDKDKSWKDFDVKLPGGQETGADIGETSAMES